MAISCRTWYYLFSPFLAGLDFVEKWTTAIVAVLLLLNSSGRCHPRFTINHEPVQVCLKKQKKIRTLVSQFFYRTWGYDFGEEDGVGK
jgi:hypothetical protein